ncbi:MAG: protein-glutamate O-methyltransferase CheR [Prolixibacteraceae bacterium]
MAYQVIQISEENFLRLAKLLTGRYGIKLPANKRILLQSRLQPRLRELEMDSFEKYCRFVFDPLNTSAELEKMVDYISTNKTSFFRENQHFELLSSVVLPDLCCKRSSGSNAVIRCWCAGCSTGQEAFSLAMTIEEYRYTICGPVDYLIVGSDISSRVLEVARAGIYPFSQSEQIPSSYLKKYVLKSKDTQNPRIRIAKPIRSRITFIHENLMEPDHRINFNFQIIFIRNTLIYFDRDNQKQILKRILGHLDPGGYLFVGLSESLIYSDLPISLAGPSLYQKHLL